MGLASRIYQYNTVRYTCDTARAILYNSLRHLIPPCPLFCATATERGIPLYAIWLHVGSIRDISCSYHCLVFKALYRVGSAVQWRRRWSDHITSRLGNEQMLTFCHVTSALCIVDSAQYIACLWQEEAINSFALCGMGSWVGLAADNNQ